MTTASAIAASLCRWCGQQHGVRCPAVAALEYGPDGFTIKRVEFVQAQGQAERAEPLPLAKDGMSQINHWNNDAISKGLWK